RNLYTSPVHFRSPSYREFESTASEQPDSRNPLQAGDQMGPFTVLYPAPACKTAFPKASDNALVLRAEIYGTRFLLLSDLGHLGQNALLNSAETNSANRNFLQADIVIAGLPGFEDDEPLSDALLHAIQPCAIIIADTRQPANKRAGAKLKQRLALHHIPVFYTSITDGITLTIRPREWELRAMDGSSISSASR
ncbi:MAG TPA: hypothetical protein VG754_09095, partial [Verrucomicrobiae bacterium]|nr:hypothetical protein [Verrucomicrobiae bacterium]